MTQKDIPENQKTSEMLNPERQNLYRKYRPQSFSELLGQEHIVKTLQMAVAQEKVSHAYLFSGPRGTGKTSAARLLAKILNCRSPIVVPGVRFDACRNCDICNRIENQNFMDIIEIDAASNNGVDDIRDMRERVKFVPIEGKVKVYIIDEVHMLSQAAFNAFLKTLEEPPPRVIFVLATTEPQKVPATIVSRCQHFDFYSISRRVMAKRLSEVVSMEHTKDSQAFPEVPNEVIHLIAEFAEGGFRDALSLLDQITSAHVGGKVTIDEVLELTRRLGYKTLKELTHSLFTKDTSGLLSKIHDLFFRGYEIGALGKDLLEYLRQCLMIKIDENANQILEIPHEQAIEMAAQIKDIPLEFLMAVVLKIERALSNLRNSAYPRLLLEIELVRISQREISIGNEGVERRLIQLEEKARAPLKQQAYPEHGAVIQVASPSRGYNSSKNITSPTPKADKKNSSSLPPDETDFGDESPDLELSSPKFSDDLPSRWRQFQKKLSQKQKMAGVYFQNSVVHSFKQGVLTVLLESGFSLKMCSEQRTFEFIQPFLKEEFGEDVKLVLKTADQDSLSPQENEATEKFPLCNEESLIRVDRLIREKLLAKPAVSDALLVFGGEIVQATKPRLSDN